MLALSQFDIGIGNQADPVLIDAPGGFGSNLGNPRPCLQRPFDGAAWNIVPSIQGKGLKISQTIQRIVEGTFARKANGLCRRIIPI